MAVAIVIDEEWEVGGGLVWASRFALAKTEELIVFVLVEKKGGETQTAEPGKESEAKTAVSKMVFRAIEENSLLSRDAEQEGRTKVSVVELVGGDWKTTILENISARSVSLLIIPRHATDRGLDPELDWERELFLRAHCEVMLLRPAGAGVDATKGVLIPVDGGPPSRLALRWARRLGKSDDWKVVALYVVPDIDQFVQASGKQTVSRIVREELGAAAQVDSQVAVSSSVRDSIAERAGQYGLTLLGANRQGAGRRWRRSSIAEWLMARAELPTVAVIRPATPLTGRVSRYIDRVLKTRIPQLDREHRVSLVERVQGSSQWNFDFIALTCLSTLIAAFGLVKDSSAVVIGAMLVAPLMTPLVGAGLSLVQGNRRLIRHAASSVLNGFALAFAIGLATGWAVPNLEVTPEMLQRDSPTTLDFVVALVSGIAAAYAMGRPNLLSALPGVAIAAALVPPVATAGLATALQSYPLALGAMLLFVTNIVAIVLGTAAALWAVGVRPVHEHGVTESWVFRLAGLLLVLTAAIGVYLSAEHNRSLETDIKAEIAAIRQETGKHDGLDLIQATRVSRKRVQILLESQVPLEMLKADVAGRLGELATEHFGDEVEVRIETRLITIAP